MTGGALHTVETEDESFDGGGGVWLPRCAGTQAVSAQRVPLAAGGGREGAAAAARTPNGAYAEFAKAIRNTTLRRTHVGPTTLRASAFSLFKPTRQRRRQSCCFLASSRVAIES